MKRLLIFFVFTALILLSACSHSEDFGNEGMNKTATTISPGQMVFTKNCRLCHGTDGTLGLSGAANLAITSLNIEEIKNVVSNGRKAMPSWKAKLSPEQIQQVAEYVLTLKK